MKRSFGLILSAIMLSLAALFFLMMGALMIFAGIASSHQARQQALAVVSPHLVLYLMLTIGIFYAALAAWAILTVIGILRLRSWARYSILIIGGGLAVLGVLAGMGTLLGRAMLPTLQAQQPAADPHIMSIVFFFMAAIDLLVAAIGVWWLVYFNRQGIRDLFSRQSGLVAGVGLDYRGGSFERAPTAIKAVGILFLVSAASCLLCAFLPFPGFLLGFILPPAAAHVLYLSFAVLAAALGYGLLRLKEPARLLAIAFLVLGCCNIFLAALPWYQVRFHLYMAQVNATMHTVPSQSLIPSAFGRMLVIFSCIFGLILYGIVFWLLHRHRAAFRAAALPPPPPMLEV